MSVAEVYVGKNVTITIHVPVVNEDQTIPSSPGPYTVTVDNIPIADSDLDGVADELAHVHVTEDGTETVVTPLSLVDSTGVITFNSADEGKAIDIDYWYELAAYVAQEFSIEPAQAIEGIDGLGTDTIQIWAPLLKTFGGTIREVFHEKPQLDKIMAFGAATNYQIKAVWDDGTYQVNLGIDGVAFPSGSLPSPKNAPVYLDTPYQAKTASTYT